MRRPTWAGSSSPPRRERNEAAHLVLLRVVHAGQPLAARLAQQQEVRRGPQAPRSTLRLAGARAQLRRA